MHHHALGTVFVQRLNDAAQVQTVLLDPKNTRAAHAIEWFEDDVLVLGMKAFDVTGIPRDQRRANEMRELKNRQFFRVVAQGSRLVENFGPFALGLLQQVRAVEKLAVKRRVFAHHHSVKVSQRLRPLVRVGLFGGKPDVRRTRQADVTYKGNDFFTALPADVFGLAG